MTSQWTSLKDFLVTGRLSQTHLIKIYWIWLTPQEISQGINLRQETFIPGVTCIPLPPCPVTSESSGDIDLRGDSLLIPGLTCEDKEFMMAKAAKDCSEFPSYQCVNARSCINSLLDIRGYDDYEDGIEETENAACLDEGMVCCHADRIKESAEPISQLPLCPPKNQMEEIDIRKGSDKSYVNWLSM